MHIIIKLLFCGDKYVKKFLKNPKSGTPNNTRKLCSAVAQHDVPSSKEYNKKQLFAF